MITDIPGIRVGHWTDLDAMTGCTVVVFPEGMTAAGEIRGGAPATREFGLLDPQRSVSQVDAVVLSGGSAFGLAAADGVMTALEAEGRGYETPFGPVPIVVGMSLFDFGVGSAAVRPGPAEGRVAFDRATDGPHEVGLVGAGTGATVDTWSGAPKPGGIGAASIRSGDVVVAALIAVNAVGAIDDGTSVADIGPPVMPGERQNTTIGIVATNTTTDAMGCYLLAQGAHDGLARSLLPAHTAGDGDAFVVGATGDVEANPLHLRALVQATVVRAVRSVGEEPPAP